MRRSIAFVAVMGLAGLLPSGCQVVGAIQAASYQPRRIPAGEDAYTRSKFLQEQARLVKRELEDAYLRIGRRNPAWDDQALAYLQAWGRLWAGDRDAPNNVALCASGKALVDAGCDDPAILYLYGVALQDAGKTGEAEPFLRRGMEGFKTIAYSRAVAAYAPLRLAAACEVMGGEKAREVKALRKLCVEWLVESLCDGSYGRDEVQHALARVNDVLGQLPLADSELLYGKLREANGVHPYVCDLVGGSVHIDKAWEARGSDWASEVSEAGWRGFEDNLKKARSLLTRAWRNYPEFPQAPTEMIRVTMGGEAAPGETERMWFDRAVAAQMDYYDAYEALMRALLPRWGGSHEEMYDFGVECLDTGRFDTDVPRYFVQTLLWITHDYEGDAGVWTTPESQRNLEKLFDGYEAATTDRRRAHWRSFRAATAWFTQDYDEACAIAEELGDALDTTPFRESFDADPAVALGQIYAFTGARGNEIRKAESRYQRQEIEAAAAAFEQLARSSDLDQRGRRFVEDRAAVARMEADFAKGEWVSLRPSPSLAGWKADVGQWSVESDGALVGRGPGTVWIHCNADFGERLELRGELEFLLARGDDPEACIELRCPPEPPEDNVLIVFHRKLGEVEVDAGAEHPMATKAEIADANSFRVLLRKDVVSVSLNGKEVISDAGVRQDVPEGRKRIGFGSTSAEVSLRVRNLQVRRLSSSQGQPAGRKSQGRAK